MTTDLLPTTARNATLADLAELLKVQHDLKHDIVVPATAIRSTDGVLAIDGAGPDGPNGGPGSFRPTEICDEGLADKLRIPLPYMKRLRGERPDLYDANVNGWLRGTSHPAADAPRVVDPDPRRFLVRCFNHPDFGEGVARAFLSQSFKVIDNLDVLTAVLDGARDAGVAIEVTACDLSERRMSVKLAAPQIEVLAPRLLGRYRSPFTGQSGADVPVVFAGIVAGNSETGGGAFQIVPRITFRVCSNGLTMTKDALRAVHLGARMNEGVVLWSDDTMRKNVELVRAQTRDAVATFLNVAYVERILAGIEEKAAVLVPATTTVEFVSKRLRYSDAHRDLILDHFIRGGDTTAGGIMQAVTSAAQVVTDPDEAYELEASALDALDAAVAVAMG